MSFGSLGVWSLGVYLVILVVVAGFARSARRDETPADHFLAGRNLGLFVLMLTLYATAYSGNSLLGYPGEAYRRGYAWIISTGMMMAIIVIFQFLVPKLRPIACREGFVTPGDWIKYRFGETGRAVPLRVAVAILMGIALGNFLLAQLVAMGHVTSYVTGGLVPYWAAVIGLAFFILVYETLGGMRAVAWTDSAQALLILSGLALLVYWLIGSGGGIEALTYQIAEVRPDAISVPAISELVNWISTLILVGFGSVVYPQAIQRVYAAQSGEGLKRAFALMSFMPLTTTLVVMLIGLAAIPRFESLGAVQADTVLPMILQEWAASGVLNSILAISVFIGVLAAIMSTADSVLLSLSSVAAGDLLGLDRSNSRTTQMGKRIAMLAMLCVVVLALFPKFTLWRLIELKMELLVQCVPSFLLAIHWRRLSPDAALAGLLLGTGISLYAVLTDWERFAGIHAGVLALIANLALAVIWTFASCKYQRSPGGLS